MAILHILYLMTHLATRNLRPPLLTSSQRMTPNQLHRLRLSNPQSHHPLQSQKRP
jgi:hypothetical protein